MMLYLSSLPDLRNNGKACLLDESYPEEESRYLVASIQSQFAKDILQKKVVFLYTPSLSKY